MLPFLTVVDVEDALVRRSFGKPRKMSLKLPRNGLSVGVRSLRSKTQVVTFNKRVVNWLFVPFLSSLSSEKKSLNRGRCLPPPPPSSGVLLSEVFSVAMTATHKHVHRETQSSA